MRVSFYFGIAFVGLFASQGRDSYYGLPKDGRKKAGGGGKKAHRDGKDIDNQQWQVLVDVTVNRQSELPPPRKSINVERREQKSSSVHNICRSFHGLGRYLFGGGGPPKHDVLESSVLPQYDRVVVLESSVVSAPRRSE